MQTGLSKGRVSRTGRPLPASGFHREPDGPLQRRRRRVVHPVPCPHTVDPGTCGKDECSECSDDLARESAALRSRQQHHPDFGVAGSRLVLQERQQANGATASVMDDPMTS